ncbi:MAG: UDP-N-acetylmuramate dehydrogenase [Patescibacteria group bacterium]
MEIFENVLLSRYSNYRIGGPALYFTEPKTKEDIVGAISWAKYKKIPLFVLGGGTNIIFRDKGFPGLVVRPMLQQISIRDTTAIAGSGVLMHDLLSRVASHSLSGLEWAGGLPGMLGGAIRGNAGAFGGEIKDVVEEVTSLAFYGEHPEIIVRKNAVCEFGYRTSVFKKAADKEIILSAVLHLTRGNPHSIRESVHEKIRFRHDRHPMDYPNIGSIFKNIPVASVSEQVQKKFEFALKTDPFPVIPAAVVIAALGFRGARKGGAIVSRKHPNFIVNAKNAAASDVRELIELIKAKTLKEFGISLEEEVLYV